MSRASIGDYIVTSKLGSGSFAVVYKGYHKVTKVPVAIKAMSLNKLNSKLLANLETEISIMRQIDHPNIVKLYEIKKTEKHIYLILEYCAGGDLQQYMRRQEQKAALAASGSSSQSAASSSSILGAIPPTKRERLSEDVAHHFLQELAKGMMCLWSHNLIHRDLKPQNLLLMEDSATSALKIADFGFARHLATTSLAETLCGSPLYMAPEILKFQKYDAKADLWSVGTILYEMVVGKPPYGGSNHVQLLANIERNDLRFPSNVALSNPCKNLLLGLLQRKPVNRMGFDDFFNHAFVGLRGTGELSQSSTAAMSLSVSRSTATMSIREEDEESAEDEYANTQSAQKDGVAAPSPLAQSSRQSLPKERATSESLDSPSPSNSALRQSRSGNMEVMQTVFGSTSSAGSAALRRSSRLGRSRRSTSSGAILVNQQTNSPKLSPQMSPHILPSPSPRINPFKQTSDSPSGAAGLHSSTHLRASGGSSQSSQRLNRPVMPTFLASTNASGARQGKSGTNAMDSSEEYVLVESGSEKQTSAANISATDARGSSVQDRAVSLAPSSTSLPAPATSHNDALLAQKLRNLTSFSHEYGQQLVDIVMLRTQAISPIAEQLWKLSSTSGIAEQRDSTSGSGTNLASMFSMESFISSSSGGQAMVGASSSSMMFGDEDSSSLVEKKQYVFAAEALALYVKCLRIIQQGIAYLRQDPVLSKRLTSSPPATSASPVPWSEASRKLSMAYLMEQLNCFLDRAEQCKKRMSSYLGNADSALVEEFQNVVVSQEELLYTHAIRLGKQGAVKEVLGQTRVAYEHYLQSMLLLESLLMDTPGPLSVNAAGATGVMAIDDQKCVNAFLKALDERLKNVKMQLDEDGVEFEQQQPQFGNLLTPSPLTSGPP